MLDFDKNVLGRYGIKFGTEELIFIKTGNGGSIYGYNNKYLDITECLYNRFGCSVVVSANPIEEHCNLVSEMEFVLSELGTVNRIIFIGVSDGALVGAQQGYRIPLIRMMLLFNGPLMINYHKTKAGIEKFQGDFVGMVYGDKDPSFRYFEMLKFINSPVFLASYIEGADHQFRGMEEELKTRIEDFVGIILER